MADKEVKDCPHCGTSGGECSDITDCGMNILAQKQEEESGELETAALEVWESAGKGKSGRCFQYPDMRDRVESLDAYEYEELVRRKDAVSHAHKWHDKGVEKERERIREILKDKKNRQEELFKKTGEESYRHTVDQINHVIDLAELDSKEKPTGEGDT